VFLLFLLPYVPVALLQCLRLWLLPQRVLRLSQGEPRWACSFRFVFLGAISMPMGRFGGRVHLIVDVYMY
jgi:hypothetical protein